MNALIDLAGRPVIAHRGNSGHAPENTLESFAQAVSLGADALELDVHLTHDGVPVVIHDASLYRTTGRRMLVRDMALAALRALDAGATFTPDRGATFPYRGRGLTIPTLADVVERFSGTPLLIEMKVAEAVEATRRVLESAGALDRVLVASSLDAPVAAFRTGALATGASSRDVLRLLQRVLLWRVPGTLPFRALCIPPRYFGLPIPVHRLAVAARRAGVTTHVWTVNDPAVAIALWRKGVQGIITDDPERMIEARRDLVEG